MNINVSPIPDTLYKGLPNPQELLYVPPRYISNYGMFLLRILHALTPTKPTLTTALFFPDSRDIPNLAVSLVVCHTGGFKVVKLHI